MYNSKGICSLHVTFSSPYYGSVTTLSTNCVHYIVMEITNLLIAFCSGTGLVEWIFWPHHKNSGHTCKVIWFLSTTQLVLLSFLQGHPVGRKTWNHKQNTEQLLISTRTLPEPKLIIFTHEVIIFVIILSLLHHLACCGFMPSLM